ncbi:MAG TPA: lactate utilization protein, partial [Syntrophorhabdaceae bacterium]|nr:lactate utilization protein [Syntrophorhabdaceae bacterium]
VTIRQLGIVMRLQERGNTVLDPVAPSYGLSEFKEELIMPTLLKATLGSDVFISGTNALTEDGKLVNIDGLGNRVTGIVFGARTSIVVIGRNKIVKNTDEALRRIKDTITPTLTKRRNLPLPCVKAGKCVDCSVPERACNITMIIEKKPPLTDLKVIVTDEDLGLGWDPDWPPERIERIKKRYEEFDWPYVAAWQQFKAKSQKR